MEAILARKALKDYNPWKSIEKLWGRRQEIDPAKLVREIRETVKEVRGAH